MKTSPSRMLRDALPARSFLEPQSHETQHIN